MKVIYKKNIIPGLPQNIYIIFFTSKESKDLAFKRISDVISFIEPDLLRHLLTGPGGYAGPIYDITDWDENTYIIGLPYMELHGKLERENKKISVDKKEFIVLLQLWEKLASENAEEITLEKDGDVFTLSGNGKKAYLHWEHFKYDWEDEDDEVYDFGLDR